MLQLLRPGVRIAFTKKGFKRVRYLYRRTFHRRVWAFHRIQFIDTKAFTGDRSDGYPGVRGIGPNRALKLIKEYGSVEGVITVST